MARLDVTRLPVRAVVRDEIYRLFLGAWMAVEAMVLFFLPFVGKWVCFVYSTWIYSLYAFEYSWALRGLNLGQRLRYFEGALCLFFRIRHTLCTRDPLFLAVRCSGDVCAYLPAVYSHGGGKSPISARVPCVAQAGPYFVCSKSAQRIVFILVQAIVNAHSATLRENRLKYMLNWP